MIKEFLKSRSGVVILSIIWGLGLATLFKKSCEGNNCRIIEYRGPTTKEVSGHWQYGGPDSDCYKLQPYIVSCKNKNPI